MKCLCIGLCHNLNGAEKRNEDMHVKDDLGRAINHIYSVVDKLISCSNL